VARQSKENLLEHFDLTDALFERRKRAVLHTMERVQKDYGDETLHGWDPNYIGRRWIALCIGGDNYEELESEQHILRGAALWILDQIANERDTRQKLFPLLPKEEREELGTRRIVWSDLDGNGHLFSGNYGDIVWDALPADLQERVPVEFYVNYNREATLGDELRLEGLREENTYRMEGIGPNGACFTALCVF
jgi:hypothetical protein